MRGHIRERSPGHWAIVIDARDAQGGQRRRRWHSFKGTKREAQVECAKLIAEAQGRVSVDPSRETVGQFMERFLRDLPARKVSTATAERYAAHLRHVCRHLGARPLQKLRLDELLSLYATLSREGMAPRTIRHIHATVSRALAQAKRGGAIRDNVATDIIPKTDLPRLDDAELPILQPGEAKKMLDALRGKPLYLIASLGLATGMRRNEMLGLRWCDVDLDAGRIRVEQSLEETVAHGIRVKAPKTRNGRRTISLPAHVIAELRAHWREQQEQRLAIGMGKASDDGPVLATTAGKWQSPNAITKAWPRAMAAIGMPGIVLHSLRHTHASMLIASGMDIITVSRRLGHGSPTVTLKVYGHLIHGADDRAAQIMDAAFGNKG